MAVKCTECGASIQDDSRFCKYCGAKVTQEETRRVEVKIDNTAEIRRAEYEEKESQLRQKKMERELRKEKRKPYIIGAKVLSVVIPFVIGFIMRRDPFYMLPMLALGCLLVGLYVFKWMNK